MAGMQVNPLTGELEPSQGPIQTMGDSGAGDDGIDWGAVLRRMAGVLGGAAGASRNQNNINDSHNLEAWSRGEAAKLNRDRFATEAPGRRLQDSARASAMSNFTPTSIQWGGPGSGLRGELPQISGGARGSLMNLDPRTKDLSSRVIDDELAMQRVGGETGGKRDRFTSPAPAMGQESVLDKILGGGATGAGLAGALAGGGPRSSGDIGKLIHDLVHHGEITPTNTTYGGQDWGNGLWGYDPGFNDPGQFTGMPDDPSGGTGVGPGMADFRNNPPQQQGGSGDDPSDNWWDE